MSTFHICLDEAGCFGFDPRGTKYYIFTAVYTYDPTPLAQSLTNLRFSLLKQGHDLPSFHCKDDQPMNRAVIRLMMKTHRWNWAGVVVEKRKVNPALYAPEVFYPKFATPLLRFVMRGCVENGTTRLVICTDSLPTERKKQAVAKALKQVCATELPKTPFWLYHHPRHSNKWIQVADYCAWGVQRKWERNEMRMYDMIKARLTKPELDLCSYGDQTTYY